MLISSPTNLQKLQEKRESAYAQLKENIVPVFDFDRPVLIEGGDYQGIWLECGPHEGLIYAQETGELDVAIANHDVFFHHQRENGQFPCWVRTQAAGYAQIQMVVPIAYTALETAKLSGDQAFLARAYDACAKWDSWLRRYRDIRKTGLCEAFCEFDTGHDRSPRFTGAPLMCSNGEAADLPNAEQYPRLPFLAPDLSATVYQGRVALSEMANLLGKQDDAIRWNMLAVEISAAMEKHCYDPQADFYFDQDSNGQHIPIRGDVITRIFFSKMLSQARFDRIYDRYIKNPKAFWTPYPLPSIAADDPFFNSDFSLNSWNGASQALTALRCPEWFEYYGKTDDLQHLMMQWVSAIAEAPEFMQQMNPWTGEFNTSPSYSPCMLTFIRFYNRLEQQGCWPA